MFDTQDFAPDLRNPLFGRGAGREWIRARAGGSERWGWTQLSNLSFQRIVGYRMPNCSRYESYLEAS